MGYSTNLIGYTVKIQELFEQGNPKPTKIKVYCENVDNVLIKTYKIDHSFTYYINEIIPKIKKDILDMEKTLDKS
jgi:hypothetical protein